MYVNYTDKPLQAISNKEKLKIEEVDKVPKWIVQNVDYYIGSSNYERIAEIAEIKKSLNETINTKEYNYVTNPYNLVDEAGNVRKYPARLRNLDIITPVKNALKGERNELDISPTVIVRNSDVADVKKEILSQLYKQAGEIEASILLKKYGLTPEEGNEELQQRFEQIYDKIKNVEISYEDYRAIYGASLLEFIANNVDMDEIQDELFDSWFDVGEIYTYKEARNNSIYYKVVNPENISIINPGRFIEDSEAIVEVLEWSFSEIVDFVSPYVTTDELKILEERYNNYRNIYFDGRSVNINHRMLKDNHARDTTTGYRVVWKSLKEYNILIYIDEYGFEQEMEVDEDYELNPEVGDVSLEKKYEECWWRCYKFFDNFYFGWEEGLEQRNSFTNSNCKLPYNGRRLNPNSSKVFSFGKIGLEFQQLYNIYHYRFEMIMAKNKDKLMLMPIGLIPQGWKRETWMYFADATGLAWFDEKNPKIAQVLQALKSIDLGLGNYAANMRDFMIGIKEEWWDFVGMNRQRYGNVMASDGKGTTEQAIFRSAIITNEFNRKFDKLIEKDYQGFLDIAKLAFIDGKVTEFINTEGYKGILEIIPEVLVESDLGIFMKNSARERNNLREAKSIIQTYISQNPKYISKVIEAIEATSVSRISQILKEGERIEQQFQERIAQQNKETAEIQAKALEDSDTRKYGSAKEVAEIKADSDERVADIQAQAKIITANSWEEGYIPDEEQLLNLYDERVRNVRKDAEDRKFNREKLQIEREKAKQAKQDKNKNNNK